MFIKFRDGRTISIPPKSDLKKEIAETIKAISDSDIKYVSMNRTVRINPDKTVEFVELAKELGVNIISAERDFSVQKITVVSLSPAEACERYKEFVDLLEENGILKGD